MFCIALFGLQAEAQSLGFSQILNVSSVEDTCPVGKVWKIVSYWQSQTNNSSQFQTSCANASYHHPFFINGNRHWETKTYGGTLSVVSNDFPLWIPEGSRLRTNCPDDFLSVIEFNVVP